LFKLPVKGTGGEQEKAKKRKGTEGIIKLYISTSLTTKKRMKEK
jgi:hypothetical protein